MFHDRKFLKNVLLSTTSFSPYMRGVVDGLNTSEGKRRLRGELSITPLLAGLLAACGGGSTKYIGGPGTGTGPGEPGPGPGGGQFNPLPFDIYVNDGLVEGATVWIDENNDGVINAGDTMLGTTDENGRVANVSGDHAGKRIIVDLTGAVDLFTGREFTGGLYTARSGERGGSDVVVSPITTLLEALQAHADNENVDIAVLLERIFGDEVPVELSDLHNIDNFILPVRTAGQTFAANSPTALSELIATTSIRLQALIDQEETLSDAAGLVNDGFDPLSDLEEAGRDAADRLIAEARERSTGEPFANPNPAGATVATNEDIEFTFPDGVWGFRDPTGNTQGESSFANLMIVRVVLPEAFSSAPSGGVFTAADGTPYQVGDTIPADKIAGLKYTPPPNVFGDIEIVYRVSDGEQQSDVATLTLTVNSVNDLPTDIVLSGDRDTNDERDLYVLNNGRVTTVDNALAGLLRAADVEANGDDATGAQTGLTYALSGAHGALFEIVTEGENTFLRLRADATALASGQTYTVIITVTDSDGGAYSETFNIIQGGLYVTPQGATVTDGTERVYSDSPTGLIDENADGSATAIDIGTIAFEGVQASAPTDVSGIKNIRFSLVSGAGDDDNEDFELAGTGALRYVGADSGDHEAGAPAAHQPDDLSIRVATSYYEVTQHSARFPTQPTYNSAGDRISGDGQRGVDATGDRTDADTREFAYSGGTISQPNPHATVGNNNIRIVAKAAGAGGNNIDIKLVYDAEREGADGTGLDALGVEVRGAGTEESPHVITIYTTAAGITTSAVKAAIEAHTQAGTDDTAAANDLVFVNTLGSTGASFSNANIRITSDIGSAGNNIQIVLRYDSNRIGEEGTGTDALSIIVTGTGTSTDNYIITIYTTRAGITTTAIKTAIDGHTTAIAGRDTAAAADLVSVTTIGAAATLDPEDEASNMFTWSLSGAPADLDPEAQTADAETGEQAITWELAGATPAPYHVAAGTIYVGAEAYSFAEAHVAHIAGNEQTYIIVALGDHDDDAETPDAWHVQAVAELPAGDEFYVLGTIDGTDDSGELAAPIRISGGEINVSPSAFGRRVSAVGDAGIDYAFSSKTAGAANTFILYVRYDATRAGANSLELGVVDLTVTGAGESWLNPFNINIYTTRGGATLNQIKAAIEAHTTAVAGTDTAAANDLIYVVLSERGRANLIVNPSTQAGNVVEFYGQAGVTEYNRDAYMVSAGTIFDGDEVIHFEGANLRVDHAARHSGDGTASNFQNIIIVRLGDHDSDDTTPDRWYVDLITPTELEALVAAGTRHYILAQALFSLDSDTLSGGGEVVPYHEIENTDIEIATQNLGVQIEYNYNVDATGDRGDSDTRTFGYTGGQITQTDSATDDEVNVEVAAGQLHLADGVVINFAALASTTVSEHSYVIVDDADGDNRYEPRIVTDLPEGDDFYVLGTVSNDGVRLIGGAVSIDPSLVPRRTVQDTDSNLVFVATAGSYGSLGSGEAFDNIKIVFIYDSSITGADSTETGVVEVRVSGTGDDFNANILTIEVYTTDAGATVQQMKDAIEAHTAIVTRQSPGVSDTAAANDLVGIFIAEGMADTIYDPSAEASNQIDTGAFAGDGVSGPSGNRRSINGRPTSIRVEAGTIIDGTEVISFDARDFNSGALGARIIIVREGDHDSDDATPDTWRAEAVASLPSTGRYYVLGNPNNDKLIEYRGSPIPVTPVEIEILPGTQNIANIGTAPLTHSRLVTEEQEYVVNLNNINDNMPVFTSQDAQTVQVTENQDREEVGVIFTAQASDLDDAGGESSIRYSLAVADNHGNVVTGLFEIDAMTGEIRLVEGQSLDNELMVTQGVVESYTLTITATSTLTVAGTDETQTATQMLTVDIVNVNEAPTQISLDREAFDPTATRTDGGLLVGTLSTSDVDTDAHTYTIAGTDASLFEIRANTEAGTNELWFIGAQDALRGAGGTYQIRITTTETGQDPAFAYSQDFTIAQGAVYLSNGRQVVDDAGAAVYVLGQVDGNGNQVRDATGQVRLVVASDADSDISNNPTPHFVIGSNGRLVLHLVGDQTASQVLAGTGLSVNDDNELMDADGNFVPAARALRVYETQRYYTESDAFLAEELPSGTANFDAYILVAQNGVIYTSTDYAQWRTQLNRDAANPDGTRYAEDPSPQAGRAITVDATGAPTARTNADIGVYIGQLGDSFGSNHFELATDTAALDNELFTIIADEAGNYHLYFTGRDGSGTARDIGDFEMSEDLNIRIIGKTFQTATDFMGITNAPVDGVRGGDTADTFFHYTTRPIPISDSIVSYAGDGSIDFTAGTLYVNGRTEPITHAAADITGLADGHYVIVRFGNHDGDDGTTPDVWYLDGVATLPTDEDYYVIGQYRISSGGRYFDLNGQRTLPERGARINMPADGGLTISGGLGSFHIIWSADPSQSGFGATTDLTFQRGTVYAHGRDEPIEFNTHGSVEVTLAENDYAVVVFGDHDSDPTTSDSWYTIGVSDLSTLSGQYYVVGRYVRQGGFLDWFHGGDVATASIAGLTSWRTSVQVQGGGEVKWLPADVDSTVYTHDYTLNLYNINDNAPAFETLSTVADAAVQGQTDAPIYTLVSDANTATAAGTFDFNSGQISVTFPTNNVVISVAAGGKLYTADGEFDIPATTFTVAPSAQDELDDTADAEFSLFQLSGGLLIALVGDDGTVTLHLIRGGTGTIAERLAGHQEWLQGLATAQDRLVGKAYVLLEFPDVLEADDRTMIADVGDTLTLTQLNAIDTEVRTDLMAGAPTYFTQLGTAGEVDPVVYFVATNENVDGGPNADPIFTVAATDADNVEGETPTETIRYVIKEGVGDSERFTLDPVTGELRFKTTADADFEIANAETGETYRTYDITIQAVSFTTLAESGGDRTEAQRVDASHDATDTDAREFVYWGADVTYLDETASSRILIGSQVFTMTAKTAGSAGSSIRLVFQYDETMSGATTQTTAGAPISIQVRGAGTAADPYIITLFTGQGGILPSHVKAAIEAHTTAGAMDTAAANDLLSITDAMDDTTLTATAILPQTGTGSLFTYSFDAVADARVTAGTIYLEDGQQLISVVSADIPVLRAGQYLIVDDSDGDGVYTYRAVSALPTTVTYYVIGKVNAEGTALEERAADMLYVQSTEQEYEVRIADQDDAPTAIGLTRPALLAGSRDVGDFTVIDQDTLALTGTTRTAETGFTYALVSGAGDTDNALFQVYDNSGTPALRFATADTARGSGNRKADIGDTYSIRVRVTDSASNTYEQVLTIVEGSIYLSAADIGGIIASSAGQLYSNFQDAQGNGILAENLEGVQPNSDANMLGLLIGRFGRAGNFEFELATASDDNDNAEFVLVGSTLYYRGVAGGSSGDFEAGDTKTIEINVLDSNFVSTGITEEYVIRLADVNEGPILAAGDTPIRVTESTVDEVQHVVLTTDMISVTDQDPGDNDDNGEPFGTMRFAVSGEQNGRIHVLNSDGEYRPASSFTLQQLRDGEVRFVHDGGEQFEIVSGFKDADAARPTQFVLTGNDGETNGAPTTFTVQVLDSPTAAVPTGSGLVYVNDPPTFETPTTIIGGYTVPITRVDQIQSFSAIFGGGYTPNNIPVIITIPDGYSSGDPLWVNVIDGADAKGVRLIITETQDGLTFHLDDAKFMLAVGASADPYSVDFATQGTEQTVGGDGLSTSDSENGYGLKDLVIYGVQLNGYIGVTAGTATALPSTVRQPFYNILEGRDNVLTSEFISAADNDNTPAEVTFTLTAIPTNGVLQKWTDANDDDVQDADEWADLAVGGTFTQEDINNNGLRYRHNGDEDATSDQFTFTIADSDGGQIDDPITIMLGIANINDTPTITGDNEVDMFEGTGNAATDSGYVLTVADIGARDDDDVASAVTYTYTTAFTDTAYKLQLRTSGTWNDLAVGGSFTLQDVQDQNVRILHDGMQSGRTALTGATFGYSVDDDELGGVGDGTAATGTVTVNIAAVNDAPVFTPSNTRIAPDKAAGENTDIYLSTTDEEDADLTTSSATSTVFTYELVRGASETTDPADPEYARYADNDYFEFEGNQLHFKSLAALNALRIYLKPEGEQYTIYVKVTDTSIGTLDRQAATSVGRELVLGVRFFDIDWDTGTAGIQSEGALTATGGSATAQSATFAILPPEWASGDGGTFTATGTPASDGFGSFTVTAVSGGDPNDFSVSYTPTVANTVIRALTAGQQRDVIYTIDTSYTPTGANAVTLRATTRFTVTFTGVNDAPVVAVDVIDSDYSLGEEPNVGGQMQSRSITGTWSFADVDTGDSIGNLRVGIGTADLVAATDLDFTNPTSSQSFEGTFGTLTVFAGTDASRSWTYTLDEAKVQSANLGPNIETFRFAVTDQTGGTGGTSSIVTLSITIQGENDIPVLTVTPPADLAVTEDDPIDTTVSGTWSVSDLDRAASLRLEINNLFAGNIATVDNPDGVGKVLDTDSSADIEPFSSAAYSYLGRYGQLVVEQDGTWTYTLTTRADSIALRETPTEVLNFIVRDENNGISATHTVTITVTGVNDAPTGITLGYGETDTANQKLIESGYRTDTEANFEVSHGSVTNVEPPSRSDIDANDRATRLTETRQEQTGTDAANDVAGRSTLTGRLDGVDADRIASTGRPTAIDLHIFEIIGAAANANDRSTTRDTTNVMIEDGNGATADPETDNPPSTGTWTTEMTGTYGHLIVNRYSGDWTYTLDNTDSDTIAIDGGDTAYDRFRIAVTDEHGASIVRVMSIEITGTNDAPVIALSGTFDLEVTESGVDASNTAVTGDTAASGAFTATDDDGDDVSFGNGINPVIRIGGTDYPGSGADRDAATDARAGTYGNFYLAANGEWRYVLDNTDADTQALAQGTTATETAIFKASDNFAESQQITVTITVTGTNDAPVISTNSGAAYTIGRDESNTAGGQVVDIDATDVDTGDTVTYTLGGTDASDFSIVPSTGVVTWASAPDHENPEDNGGNNVYEFTVIATDGTGATDTIAVTVNVQDINDEDPVFTSATTVRANENIRANDHATEKGGTQSEPTAVVYTAAATPDRASDSVVYSLEGSDDDTSFGIDSSTGEVWFRQSPDHETKSSYTFTVRATVTETVSGGADRVTMADRTVTVTINDLNDNAPVITGGGSRGETITEGTATSFTIYTVSATPDVSTAANDITANTGVTASTLTYAISTDTGLTSNTDSARFTVDSATGAVRLAAVPDHENAADSDTNNIYRVRVIATATTTEVGKSNPVTQTASLDLTVTISDLNDEAPVFTSGTTASVNEGVAANDHASNKGGTQSAPTAVVYTAAATPDRSSDSVVYSLLSSGDGNSFGIDSSSGEVWFRQSPDHETKSSYTFTVRASVTASSNTETADRTVTLTINDLNDEAPVFNNDASHTVNVDEGAAVGTDTTTKGNGLGFYTATAVKDRTSDTLTYAILADATVAGNADRASFGINRNTGEIWFIGTSPDHETKDTYNLIVRASSTDGTTTLTADQAITVNINDLNDVAPSFTSSTPASVDENVAVGGATAIGSGHLVHTFTVDPDVDDSGTTDKNTITYSIQGTADNARFGINNQGQLWFKPGNSPDAEMHASFTFTVEASVTYRGTAQTATQSFTLNINDLHDADPAWSRTSGVTYKVNENVAVGATGQNILTPVNLTAIADKGTLTYHIKTGAGAGDGASFIVSQASNGDAELRFASGVNPDHETKSSYTLTLIARSTVTGGETPATRETELVVNVELNDLNDVDPAITSGTSATAHSISVAENTPTTTAIYTLAATPDVSTLASDITANTGVSASSITYSIKAGQDGADFSIDGSTGALTFASLPDYEDPADADTNNVYTLTVVATATTTEGGSAVPRTAEQVITVTVTDVDENAAPTGTSRTVTVYATSNSGHYFFDVNDFGYADTDGDALDHIEITKLETAGALKLGSDADHDGDTTYTDVTVNQDITLVDIPKLRFEHGLASFAANTDFAHFDFRVNDGTDYSATPANRITIALATGNAPAPTITATGTVTTGSITEKTVGFGEVTGRIIGAHADVPLASTGAYRAAIQSGQTGGTQLGAIGTFEIDAAGFWTYKLNSGATDAAINSALENAATAAKTDSGASNDLEAGDSFNVVYTVTVTDRYGGTVTQDVTITVNGITETAGGSSGADTINAASATTSQFINAGAQNDTITASTHGDIVIGGYGIDTINLQDSGSVSSSHAGADTIVYRIKSDHPSGIQALDGGDTIKGFSAGIDKLVLVDTADTATTLSDLFASLATNIVFFDPQEDNPISGVNAGDGLTDAEIGLGARLGVRIDFDVAGTIDGTGSGTTAQQTIRIIFDAHGTKDIDDNYNNWFDDSGTIADFAALQTIFGADSLQLFSDAVLPSDFF